LRELPWAPPASAPPASAADDPIVEADQIALAPEQRKPELTASSFQNA
jgi:hypothetical protein